MKNKILSALTVSTIGVISLIALFLSVQKTPVPPQEFGGRTTLDITSGLFDPSATSTPTADKIVRANGSGKIENDWLTTNLTGGGDAVNLHTHTNVSHLKIASTTEVTVSNNDAETAVVTYTIPANSLGTDQVVKVTIPVKEMRLASGDTLAIRFKYGATTMVSASFADGVTMPASPAYLNGFLTVYLVGAGSTSAQKMYVSASLANNAYNWDFNSVTGGDLGITYATGTATQNSTGALDFVFSVDYAGGPSSNNTFTTGGYIVEMLAN